MVVDKAAAEFLISPKKSNIFLTEKTQPSQLNADDKNIGHETQKQTKHKTQTQTQNKILFYIIQQTFLYNVGNDKNLEL